MDQYHIEQKVQVLVTNTVFSQSFSPEQWFINIHEYTLIKFVYVMNIQDFHLCICQFVRGYM